MSGGGGKRRQRNRRWSVTHLFDIATSDCGRRLRLTLLRALLWRLLLGRGFPVVRADEEDAGLQSLLKQVWAATFGTGLIDGFVVRREAAFRIIRAAVKEIP